jgi:beta-lactamase class A
MALTRRTLLAGGLVAAVARPAFAQTQDAIAALERSHGGRLGVCILDVKTGQRVTHRADERFAMCSTFKVLAAAMVLTQVDRGEDTLGRRIMYTAEDVVTYSPETAQHVGDGMTLGAICQAALTLSDNTAGNLMVHSIGGPPQLTSFARSIGDAVSRLDRLETALNEATPGDPRDTTTPAAMAGDLQRILLGDLLSPDSRDQMTRWMIANKTGDQRLRAGLPAGWRVADKTGAGDHAATNDIAMIWPPDRGPRIVTVYYAESLAPVDERNAVIAEIGRLAAEI